MGTDVPLSVYYLRITLIDSSPSIWRDVLVPSNITLEELHYVIQTAMGWGNCHSHQFIAENVIYNDGLTTSQYSEVEEFIRHERKYTLSQLVKTEGRGFIYEYDLADSWAHEIELRKILPADADARKPRCVQGEQACPPEDCGGIWGYTDLLETLHYDHDTEEDSVSTGLGKDFNPNHFDIDMVNRVLNHLLFDAHAKVGV